MPRLTNFPELLLSAALVVYLAISLSFACIKTPWIDEGWIASAPANWAATGRFGSPSIEPTGTWLDADLTGIRDYTYWNMPVGLAFQGLWYKTVGFSIFKMRLLSILSGLLVIFSWFTIVRCLSGSKSAAALTALLLSLDFTFLWSAADGRMDMLCVALGSAGFATYLHFRARNLTRAFYCSHSLLALSLFTHPNGILFVFAVLLAFLHFDRNRTSWRLLPTLLPYFLVAGVWCLYIAKAPDYFMAQFGANASAMGGSRWDGLTRPLEAIQLEAARYLGNYGFFPIWLGTLPRYTASIPLILWSALLACSGLRFTRSHSQTSLLVLFTWLSLLYMTFFTIKTQNYLVYILPAYLSLFAIWVVSSHAHQRAWAPVTALMLGWLIFCDVSVAGSKIAGNAYASQYLPIVHYLKQQTGPGRSIMGGSYLGFGLGFDNIDDDARLGFYTGREADFVVEDRFYSQWWKLVFQTREPVVYRFLRDRLRSDYGVVLVKDDFKVYARHQRSISGRSSKVTTTLRWLNFDGELTHQQRLPGLFADPAILPDRKALLLIELRPGFSQLVRYDMNTSEIRPILPATEHASNPVCATELDVCAVSLRRENRLQLFSYSPPAASLNRLLYDHFTDLAGAWTANGNLLAFTRFATPFSQFGLYSSKDKQSSFLQKVQQPVSEIQFSPDQKHVLFTLSDAEGKREEVYKADLCPALSNIQRVSLEGGHSGHWLSDSRIAFIRPDQTLNIGSGVSVQRALGFTVDLRQKEIIIAAQ